MAVKASTISPPKAEVWSIEELLGVLQEGRIGIPSFQRDFQWNREDILTLFDSIYRGYPIGNLLFWETRPADGTRTQFGPLIYPPKQGDHLLVVDGQQRLTSLAVVLLRKEAVLEGVDSLWSVFFDLESETFVLPGRQAISSTWLPLNEILNTERYLRWTRRLPAEPTYLVERADRVASSIKNYRIPVYVVRSDEESEVRTIFRRMNDNGRALKEKDVFQALTGRRDALKSLQSRLLPFGFGTLDDQLLLKSVMAVTGSDARKSIKARLDGREGADWESDLEETRVALGLTFEFLMEDAGIPHVELLPYPVLVAPLARLFHLHRQLDRDATRALRCWLWRGIENGDFERLNPSSLADTQEALNGELKATLDALRKRLTARKNTHALSHRHDFRSNTTKILGCLLASLRPRHLEEGSTVDVRRLLDRSGSGAFIEILPRRRFNKGDSEEWSLRATTANRVLHPEFHGTPSLRRDREVWSPVVEAARRATPEVLESHALADALASAHRDQAPAAIVRRRAASLQKALVHFFEDRIEG